MSRAPSIDERRGGSSRAGGLTVGVLEAPRRRRPNTPASSTTGCARLDGPGVDVILAVVPADADADGIGAAVADRLRRAATGH